MFEKKIKSVFVSRYKDLWKKNKLSFCMFLINTFQLMNNDCDARFCSKCKRKLCKFSIEKLSKKC